MMLLQFTEYEFQKTLVINDKVTVRYYGTIYYTPFLESIKGTNAVS